MYLPSIVEVAEKQGIEINPRSLNKKEVYAKCPFCLGDSNKAGKYKLSMNQELNCFKCWLCGTSGGVLEFESKITGVSFNEVKRKYFGDSKKKRHSVEYLSPIQLRKIGWDSYKRKNREDFMKKRDLVLLDWKDYEYKESVKHFALFVVTAQIDCSEDRRSSLLAFILESTKKTGIHLLFSKVMEQYVVDDEYKTKWALEGLDIARAAWRACQSDYDFGMDNIAKHVLFLHYLN